jgi:hypothetical protein
MFDQFSDLNIFRILIFLKSKYFLFEQFTDLEFELFSNLNNFFVLNIL